MYLTRMELDIKKRSTMKALGSPNLFHGAIESAFPGERTRKLWRIDNLDDHCYILLLSDMAPQLEQAAKQFGFPDADKPWETKDYENLLERIEIDTVWQFRLTANPTKCCRTEQGERGKVYAHITPFYQKIWLLERSEKNGFFIDEESCTVTKSVWHRFYKGIERKRPVTLLSVTYEGILRVTDVEKFRKTLTDGIGRGKAFGMGMLTVVRVGDIKV